MQLLDFYPTGGSKKKAKRGMTPSDLYRRGMMRLGEGSFGSVFAVKRKSGEVRALKVCMLDTKRYNNMVNELRIMTTLGHNDFIVHAFCSFVYKRKFFIEMEYATFGDVQSVMKSASYEDVKLDERTNFVASVLTSAIHATEFLHSLSILHGDIKTNNLAIFSDGKIKLIDFGESKRMDDVSDTAWKNSDMINIGEMADEMFLNTYWDYRIGHTILSFQRGAARNKDAKRVQRIVDSIIDSDTPNLTELKTWCKHKSFDFRLLRERDLGEMDACEYGEISDLDHDVGVMHLDIDGGEHVDADMSDEQKDRLWYEIGDKT